MCDASMAMCDGSMGHRRLAPWAMCDGSMGHVRRLHGPQAAGKLPCTCTTTLSSLDAAVVTRRRRRETSFAFPWGGGAPTGASLHLRPPLRRRRPRREYADCTYVSDCAVCGPRVRACRGGRPRWRSAPRTALQRSRTPLTAIATAAALAPSTWVASSVLGKRGPRTSDCACADCGPRFPPPPPICAETRNWASVADCDDGGPGSEFRPAPGSTPGPIVRCV